MQVSKPELERSIDLIEDLRSTYQCCLLSMYTIIQKLYAHVPYTSPVHPTTHHMYEVGVSVRSLDADGIMGYSPRLPACDRRSRKELAMPGHDIIVLGASAGGMC